MGTGTFFLPSALSVLVAPALSALEGGIFAWRPPEWTQQKSAPTSITIPGYTSTTTGPSTTLSTGAVIPGAPQYVSAQLLVFDSFERIEHAREVTPTRHPIQTSGTSPVASVSDHAIQQPARVVLEIGMSDAMASYQTGMWSGSRKSKSVSAYQQLVTLLEQKTILTLTTRLGVYSNMIVESLRAPDDVTTMHGLRASVTFSKMFFADGTAVSSTISFSSSDTSGNAVSARSSLTDSSSAGTQQTVTPSNALTQQFNVQSALYSSVPAAAAIPGAGNWSSNPVSSLGGL